MTESVNTVLVVGSTGQTGRVAAATALKHGLQVRALARDIARARRLLPGAGVVEGNLSDASTLAEAVEGVDAVVFTHGATGGRDAYERVDYGGVANVLRALAGRRPRIVLMTSIDITTTTTGPYADLMSWKRRSERLVRASGAAYTIVRPGWLDTSDPSDQQLRLAQGDTGTGAVSRRQVAEVLVRSLITDEAVGRTFELFATAGGPPQDWPGLFAQTAPDQPGSLDGARDAATLPIDAEPQRVRHDLDAVCEDRALPSTADTAPSPASPTSSGSMNPSDERAREDILANYRERTSAMIDGHTDRLAELLDDDFTAVHIIGYEQNKAEWLAQIDSGQMSYDAAREELAVVEVNGDTAVLTIRARVTATINGSHGTWPLESVTQYARNDGVWKATQSQATTY